MIKEITVPNLDAMEKILDNFYVTARDIGPYSTQEAEFCVELFKVIKPLCLESLRPKEIIPEEPKRKWNPFRKKGK